jgi:hypothetical protein
MIKLKHQKHNYERCKNTSQYTEHIVLLRVITPPLVLTFQNSGIFFDIYEVVPVLPIYIFNQVLVGMLCKTFLKLETKICIQIFRHINIYAHV